MQLIRDFIQGFAAHLRGARFAFSNPSYIPLLLIPFCLTIFLFVFGIWAVAHWSDVILGYFWTVDPATAGQATSIFYWIYTHIVKYLLYVVVLGGMYFAFMVVANVLASPLYDAIASRIRKLPRYAALHGAAGVELSMLRMVLEEAKKALFVLFIPLPFLVVPVIGPPIAMVLAMTLLSWDFLDFSLAKDAPTFKARFGYVLKNSPALLGFGVLLFVPFLNFLIYPFAILGATLLYEERLLANREARR